jgi:acyl-CoA thioesterase-2
LSYTLSDYAALAALRAVDGGFEADTLSTWMGTLSGAQVMFQQIAAAESAEPAKRVLSLHTIFANGGHSGQPVSIDIETLQSGRSFASLSITVRQQQLVISRALALMTTDEDDYLRHQIPAPAATNWASWPIDDSNWWPGWVRKSPDSSTASVKMRFGVSESTTDPTTGRGLVAVATEQGGLFDGLMLLTEDSPIQEGRPASMVLTHTVTFVEPTDGQSLVVTAVPSYAGHGRANGSGHVTDDNGHMLATFMTTGLLRAPRK